MFLADSKYIRIEISRDEKTRNRNPTPQQRAVYNFHEQRHSNEAEDIYASTWFNRTQDFLHNVHDDKNVLLKDWDMIRELDFGVFFLAHPVAGYSLWLFLQTCDELDIIVCGASQITSWSELKPFQVMKCDQTQQRWIKHLDLLQDDISTRRLRGDRLLQKLYAILDGLYRLESVYTSLETTFLSNLEGKYLADQMMNTIRSTYEWRCRMISDLSVMEKTIQYLEDDKESSSSEGVLGNSKSVSSNGSSRSRPLKSTRKNRKRRSKARKNRNCHPSTFWPEVTWLAGTSVEVDVNFLPHTLYRLLPIIVVILAAAYALIWSVDRFLDPIVYI